MKKRKNSVAFSVGVFLIMILFAFSLQAQEREGEKILCPKCGNKEAFWILRQMRGSDEPESRFYTCNI